MMGMEEFAQAVLAAVREKSGGIFDVGVTVNVKNNGRKLTGIYGRRPGCSTGPCIYLDGYYSEYRGGQAEVSGVAETVFQQIMGHQDDMKKICVEDILQWDRARHRIYAKLVNAGMNREALGGIPHRHFLDLAVVYYIKMDDTVGEGGMASVLVQDQYMEKWGQDEESLYRTASANRRMDGGPFFQDVVALVRDLSPGAGKPSWCDAAGAKMYVLTNQDGILGAVEILDRATLRAISEKLAGDFIVFPSSVHETLIVPDDGVPGYGQMADMVRGINASLVDLEERLSDHVYKYDRDKGILEIVA